MGADSAGGGGPAPRDIRPSGTGFEFAVPGIANSMDDGISITGTDHLLTRDGVTVGLLGEIYGGGVDTVLDRYFAAGMAGVVGGIEGSFVLVVNDDAEGETYVVTDHIGSRAAYLWDLGDRRLVTNTLGDGPRSHVEIDAAGVCSYLANDGVRSGLTPYQSVRSVPPGSMMSLRTKSPPRRYWRFPVDPQPGSIEERSAEMIDLMRRAVDKRLSSLDTDKVVVSLSGGVDSKGLLGLLTEQMDPGSIETVTYFHGEQVGDMDLSEARAAADAVGVAHRAIPGYLGDFVTTLVDNALVGDGVAHFCDEADAWRFEGGQSAETRMKVAGDRQSHHYGSIPDDIPTEAMLRLINIFPAESIDWFLGSLDPQAADSMTSGWGDVYEATVGEYRSFESWRDAIHPAYLEQRTSPTLTLWRELFSRRLGPVVSPYLDRSLLEFVGRLSRELNDVNGTLLHRITLERAFPSLFERGNAHGGWNIPDWGTEMTKNRDGLARFISSVDSPLESLIPKDRTLGLLDDVASASPQLTSATSGWRWKVRRTVKSSAWLTKMVRQRKFQGRVSWPTKVSRAALLRRLLTLHLALADHEQVRGLLSERSTHD